MATETAQTHIDAALRNIGVTKPSSAQRINGLEAINDMISHWSADNLILPSITTETLTLSTSSREYTIGSGGDFNTTRPMQIYNAFLRDSNNDDFPLDIYTKKEYNRINDKTVSGRPREFVFIKSVTLGKIIFDLTPDEAYSFILDSYKPLTELALLTTTLTLPDEYKLAVKYNLALQLAAMEDIQVSPIVQQIAVDSLRNIRALRAEPIPEVQFDRALLFRAIREASPDITTLT